MMEPRIHSHITDELPGEHYLAHTAIYCSTCGEMVHASNNECMQTWVEFGEFGNYCIQCFGNRADSGCLDAMKGWGI
jgi:hypothetical protein